MRSGKVVQIEVEGDCCSSSWFSDINGLNDLIGEEIYAVEEVEMTDAYKLDARQRSEEDAAYGIKIQTLRGYVDIVFRNSSNGYYGGWIGQVSVLECLPDTGIIELDCTKNEWVSA